MLLQRQGLSARHSTCERLHFFRQRWQGPVLLPPSHIAPSLELARIVLRKVFVFCNEGGGLFREGSRSVTGGLFREAARSVTRPEARPAARSSPLARPATTTPAGCGTGGAAENGSRSARVRYRLRLAGSAAFREGRRLSPASKDIRANQRQMIK